MRRNWANFLDWSGRENFELREIVGNRKAVCLLPESSEQYVYPYPPTEGMSDQLEHFEKWLGESLKRRVISWKDWGDVDNYGHELKMLTDKEEVAFWMDKTPWAGKTMKVSCTANMDSKIEIVRRGGFYYLNTYFEREYLLKN